MDAGEIIALTDLLVTALGRVNNIRAALRQSGELTPEQDAALDEKLRTTFSAPHWQPSGEPETSSPS